MASEFEVKYRSSPAAMELLEAAYGPFETVTMETAYYDAPGRPLAARYWTLRRRLENGRSICALKTPGDGVRQYRSSDPGPFGPGRSGRAGCPDSRGPDPDLCRPVYTAGLPGFLRKFENGAGPGLRRASGRQQGGGALRGGGGAQAGRPGGYSGLRCIPGGALWPGPGGKEQACPGPGTGGIGKTL